MSDFPDFVMQLLLVVCISIGVSEYVFLALGLFTMAKQRSLRGSGLAWLPLGNLYLLGRLSDRYRLLSRGKKRFQRWVLPSLSLIQKLALIITLMGYLAMLAYFSHGLHDNCEFAHEEVLDVAIQGGNAVGVALPVAGVSLILLRIFKCIAFRNVMLSCGDTGVRSIIGIIFCGLGIELPTAVFVFLGRDAEIAFPPEICYDEPIIQ